MEKLINTESYKQRHTKMAEMLARQSSLSFIPALLPNQTLYSWASMFHEMSGNATVRESLVQTFALTQKGLHFHIPSHLEVMCANTQLALGAAENIVEVATTLPFYTKFRSPDLLAKVMKLVRGNSSHGVAQALGMAKTASHGHPSRRSCIQCIQSDLEVFGFAYWHRDHQLPGALVCQKHGAALLSLPYDHNSIHGEALLQPNDDWRLIDAKTHQDWSRDTLIALHRLAKLAADMTGGNLAGGYSMRQMRNTCLRILNERKLIAQDGSLMTPEAFKSYGNHFISIVSIPEINWGLQCSIRPLLYVLKLSERRIHPLEWMLIIDWLFGDWVTFEKHYREKSE
jgi:hypothetical protein